MAKQYFNLMEFEQISHVIQQATSLGVLDDLIESNYSANQLATRRKGDALAYGFLLDALAAIGYIELTNGVYSATDEFRKLRCDGSFRWAQLSQYLSDGKPWIEIDKSVETLDGFYSAFFADVDYANQMSAVASEVAVRLSGDPQDILDVGTGTGLWSLAMLARMPGARVTGIDLPGVLQKHFHRRAAELGCEDRVRSIEGDFHTVDFGEAQYDRIVFGSSFHFVRVDRAEAVLQKAARALRPTGRLVIIDHFADGSRTQRLSRVLYEMRLAMRTSHAKNYSRSEIVQLSMSQNLTVEDEFEVNGPGFLSVLAFGHTPTH